MARTRHRRGEYRCSFCGKDQDQVQRLIAGPGGVYICDECVHLCNEILAEGPTPRLGGQGAGTRPRAGRAGAPWWRHLFGGRDEWQIQTYPGPGAG
jgi:hypothetical protein